MTYKKWKLVNDTLIQVSALVSHSLRISNTVEEQVKYMLPDVVVIDSIDKLFALQHPLKTDILISQACVADLLAFFAKQFADESNANAKLVEHLQLLVGYAKLPWYKRLFRRKQLLKQLNII